MSQKQRHAKHIKLLSIVALNGALIMCLELTGSRLLAPFFGSSMYIWTTIIGVILAFLAIGYWYGGRIADASPSEDTLAKVLFIASIATLTTQLTAVSVLKYTSSEISWPIAGVVFATVYIFGVVSILLGMVSPIVARLQIRSTKDSGEEVGSVFAAGTVGSIVGTFLTGFVLFSFVPSRTIGYIVSLVLVLLSLVADRKVWLVPRIVFVLIALTILLINPQQAIFGRTLLDTDTSYSRVIVKDIELNSKPTRVLVTDALGAQSGTILDSDEPAFEYVLAIRELFRQNPDQKTALLIGGGAYTLPTVFTKLDEQNTMDVVEIDPQLQSIAKEYFRYQPNDRIRDFSQDGREYLNKNTSSYDVIVVDAYSALSPPFQLSTLEATEKMRESVGDGLVIANIVSRVSGPNNFLQAQAATYKSVFRYVEAYQVASTKDQDNIQNSILLASNNPIAIPPSQYFSKKIDLNPNATILTDQFAPVEAMTFYNL